MRRVFPDRPSVDTGENEEILHMLYVLDKRTQIPGRRHLRCGPVYPARMTAFAYRFGINYVIYAMTHRTMPRSRSNALHTSHFAMNRGTTIVGVRTTPILSRRQLTDTAQVILHAADLFREVCVRAIRPGSGTACAGSMGRHGSAEGAAAGS